MKTTVKRSFKNQLFEHFARIGKALANGHRLEILELLAQGERSVEALALETDLSIANASQHLQVLKACGLIEVRREGTFGFYQLADQSVFALWQAMRTLGETHLAEVDRLVTNHLERQTLESISLAELGLKLKQGKVTLLDVRPLEEFNAGHIRGAMAVPLAELELKLKKLPKRYEVVAYCRGPYCVFADDAVALLLEHGFKARRLELGLPDWRMAGYPVEQGLAA